MNNMVLMTLGIKDDIYYMLDRVGWTVFMSMRYPTYIQVTLEFLSFLEVQILQGVDCEKGKIQFRLFNIEYEWILS